MPQTREQKNDRYEPMPAFVALPAWLWRRMPAVAKAIVVIAFVALIGVAIAIGPDIVRSKNERERAEQLERARAQARREEEIRQIQEPVFMRGRPARASVRARGTLVAAARSSVLEDARRRASSGELGGPIRGVSCEPFPRSVSGVGAERRPGERFGRYACLAVTARIEPGEASMGGRIGHPYRLRIDFESGRYAFCKIVGRPAEGQLRRDFGPTVPRACGGGP